MIAGAFLAWNAGASLDIPRVGVQVAPNITGLEWQPARDRRRRPRRFDPGAAVPRSAAAELDPLVSAGAVVILLAALAMIGSDRVRPGG